MAKNGSFQLDDNDDDDDVGGGLRSADQDEEKLIVSVCAGDSGHLISG